MSTDPFAVCEPSPRVVGAGLVALDALVPYGSPKPSHLRAGGTCGNVLTVLAHLGWDSYPVARLKDNASSRRLLEDLERWSVKLDFISVSPEGSTPVFVHTVSRTRAGDTVHSFTRRCPGCGGLLPGYKAVTVTAIEQLLSTLPRPQVFFFDRASRGSVLLAKHCSAQGALVMFEPAGVGEPPLFREAVQVSHILKYSHERLGEAEDLLAECERPLQVETLGRDGLRYRSRLRNARSPDWKKLNAFSVGEVRDASGAGDWCSAGLLHRLGQSGRAAFLATGREELKEALRFGMALGACNCGFEGARAGMYELTRQELSDEVKAILADGRAMEMRESRLGTRKGSPAYDFCSLCNPD